MKDWTRVMKSVCLIDKILFRGSTPLRSLGSLNSTQERTLLAVYDNPGKSQKELIRYMNRDKGSISKIIQNLVEQGLVERLPSENDRRQVLLILSPKGEKETQRIHEKYSSHISNIVSILEKEKQDELYMHLDRLLELTLEVEERSRI